MALESDKVRFFVLGGGQMSELSIFIDESGDFGSYNTMSPYYLVTFLFHNQSVNILEAINLLERKIHLSGFPDIPIHSGP